MSVPRPLRVLLHSTAAAALVLAACHLRTNPRRLLEAPPAWDAAALAAFAEKGIAPPRTARTGETPVPLDVAALRDAVASPALVDAARREQLQRAGRGSAGDDTGVAAEAAAPGERADLDAPAATLSAAPTAAMHLDDAPSADPQAEGEAPVESKDAPADSRLPRKLTGGVLAERSVAKVLFQNEEGRFEALVPRTFRLQVFADGPRARTIVEYAFENPHDRRLQGTFHYTLPAGATPAAFGMFRAGVVLEGDGPLPRALLPALGEASVPRDLEDLAAALPSADLGPAPQPVTSAPDWGELQRARVVEQVRAREVYEAVVRKDIDPALLEWAGGNTFRARVFPIEPRALKRVFLVFEETLAQEGGLLRYHHALPEDLAAAGQVEVRAHVRAASLKLARRGDFAGSIRSHDGWQILDLRPGPGDQDFQLDLIPTDPSREVIVEERAGGMVGAAFYARLTAELPRRERSAPTGRALFLIDTSLSSDGPYHGLAGDLLQEVLARDSTIAEYAVMLFDLRPRWLHAAAWRSNDEAARAETAAELEKVFLEGATSFAAVLDEIEANASWIADPALPATAFLLSDGQVTWGQAHAATLLHDRPAGSALRWISYRFGTVAANTDLFAALAGLNDGRTVHVLSADQVGEAALAHRTAPAILRGVSLTGARASDLTVAGDPRLLFPGQELRVAGRVDTPDRAVLRIDLEIDGAASALEIPLAQATPSPLAGRAFAELYTQKLLALDDERLHRMVVALSQRFHLANAAASLLILDNDADWKSYDLADERVDLADLERLRAQEEDQRRDRLQGIALDEVPAQGRDVIRLLQQVDVPAELRPPATPLLDRPLAGGEARIAAEVAYRAARPGHEMDLEVYRPVAEARALCGDTLGALRAWSSLVEMRPQDAEAARIVGYACLALGQYQPAAEVFEHVRLQRPFEPQAYLEEALALEAAGSLALAVRNYEIVLARAFPRHQDESRIVAARQLGRLLLGVLRDLPLEAEEHALLQSRCEEVSAAARLAGFPRQALQVTLHWNSDGVDIDLWVLEPEGERCFYGHRETAAGGRLLWDITNGYGPELYHRPQASAGEFEILAHFYGNNSARFSVPTGALVVVDRGAYAAEDTFTRRFQAFVLGKEDGVLSLRGEKY